MARRILIIDECEEIREMYKKVLGKECEFITASSVKEAEMLYFQGEYDAAIVDIDNEGDLGRLAGLKAKKLVVTSNYGDVIEKAEKLRKKAMRKPFNMKDLEDCLSGEEK